MNEENEQIRGRRAKLAALRERGNPYPNDFRPNRFAADLHRKYDREYDQKYHLQPDAPGPIEELGPKTVKVAGRLMSRRLMGRASFAHVQDTSGRIQLFVERATLPEGDYEKWKKYDTGDLIGAEGKLFHTRSGELSVRVRRLHLLAKCLRPLPEKYHGLSDAELKHRRRHVDLIMSEDTRQVFRTRAAVIHHIRTFLHRHKFLEVETPMMHPIPGGAVARPFTTHHNALDMTLYLRVAPELYLKRLVVGGLERVFEIGRSFRNEGVSTRHNPEFTMLEFYQAYADHHAFMNLTEKLLRSLLRELNQDGTSFTYQQHTLNFATPFRRMTLAEALRRHHPKLTAADLDNPDIMRRTCESHDISIPPEAGCGRLQMELFEKTVEPHLINPTFITAYPVEVSPLSRRNDENPAVSDRFELFIAGREIANGFAELNDPEDQAERFRRQAARHAEGDPEAMHFDRDYIHALEYGMPPTAGEGIGIDRLVMLLTNRPSIRDVLLFPHLRAAPAADP